MSCSVLSTNSLSEVGSYGGDPSSKKERSVQVLNTMMKILSCLNNITFDQIEKSYKMAVLDKKCKLPDTQKAMLFKELVKFTSIVEILYLKEDQSKVLRSPIALVRNREGNLVLSRWSVDSEDRKESEVLSELMRREKVTSALVICLDRDESYEFPSEGPKSLNTSIELQKPLKTSTESQKSLYKEPRIINQIDTPLLAERVMQSSQPKTDYTTGFVANTQSQNSPLKAWSSNSGTTSFPMNYQHQSHYQPQYQPQPQPQVQHQSQYQSISRKETDQERDIRKVWQQLGDSRLDTPGLVRDFGRISFRELFKMFLSDPDNALNAQWISYCRKGFSSTWKDSSLVAVREYFRKY
jgi:hypothetical protein